jgi:hypothetical protein
MTWIVNNCYLSFIVWIRAQKVVHYFILSCGSIVTKANPSSLLRTQVDQFESPRNRCWFCILWLRHMTRSGRSERATFLLAKPQTPIIAVGLLQADDCMKWEVKTPARVGCRNAAEIETTRWPDPPASCRKASQFPIRDIQYGSSFLLFSS